MKEFTRVAFIEPLEELVVQIGVLLPHLLGTVFIISVGVFISVFMKMFALRILKVTQFDQFIARVGFTESMTKGRASEIPTVIISRIVFWSIFLVFLMLGLGTLKLKAVDQFVSLTLSFMPHFLMALLILTVGLILANYFSRAVLIAAVNAQWRHARTLARGVRLITVVFALAMSFEQLGIATTIIVATFSIVLGGVVLALAIAFGLGAKDLAKEFIQDRIQKTEEPTDSKEKDLSHL